MRVVCPPSPRWVSPCLRCVRLSRRRLFRFDETPKELDHLHDTLWALSTMTADALERYRKHTLREYLEESGVVEPYISMACAGYANTLAGNVNNLSTVLSARSERLWIQDGDNDQSITPNTGVVREASRMSLCTPHTSGRVVVAVC